MKVLFLTNIPSPYMVDFLNELGKKCDLTAVFERESSGVRDKSWKKYQFESFLGIVLKGKNIKVNAELDDQAICPQIIRYIKKEVYDAIIVANPCTPTGMIAILYMKLRGIPYGIQSEGGFPKDGKGLKEKIKKFMMTGARLYFSTADMGDQYFLQYGAEKEKIYRYPFTSLYNSEILCELLTKEEKNRIKRELGIPYEKIVISVGRFIEVKGFDVFMQACAKLEGHVGIYIIGGEPTEEYLLLQKELKLTNLHFVGHVDKEMMKRYYCAADIFALNSRGDTWGLVINEAMSYGLPVVSSDKCYASLALIEEGENGYVVPVDDIHAFHEKIVYLLEHDSLREKIGEKNLEKSQEYTLEHMAEREMEILKEVCYGGL